MNATRTPSSTSLTFPMLFLIGTMIVLALLFMPQPVRPTLTVASAVEPTVEATQAAEDHPVLDTSQMDHLTLMALGLEEVPASNVQRGRMIFSISCSTCHGMDARGIPNLGKSLIDSVFVNTLNDPELVQFITEGRAATDPANTTGVAMPPRGNNPALTEEDLNAVVDYIRSMNGATVVDDSGTAASQPAVPTSDAPPVEFTPLNPSALAGALSGSGEATPEAAAPAEPDAPTQAAPVPTTDSGSFTPLNPNALAGALSGSGEATPEATPPAEATPVPATDSSGFTPLNPNALAGALTGSGEATPEATPGQ